MACAALCASGTGLGSSPARPGPLTPLPEAALRGTLSINTASEATLNGKTIRMAPGMRLFSPRTPWSWRTPWGQTFKVNYVLENSTGMLHAAWILTEGEAAQPRKGGSDGVITNITTSSAPRPEVTFRRACRRPRRCPAQSPRHAGRGVCFAILRNCHGQKVFIKTFGCQMNEYDSDKMADVLNAAQATSHQNVDEADLILFNTCSVREKRKKGLQRPGPHQAPEGARREDWRGRLRGQPGRRRDHQARPVCGRGVWPANPAPPARDAQPARAAR